MKKLFAVLLVGCTVSAYGIGGLVNPTISANGGSGGSNSYTLPIATVGQIGGVRPDGTTTSVDGSGVLSVIGSIGGSTNVVQLINTNFVSGKWYQNTYPGVILVRSVAYLVSASTTGSAQMALYVSPTGAPGTIAGNLFCATSPTNMSGIVQYGDITTLISNGWWYAFTNLSTGVGVSAALQSGGQIAVLAAGTVVTVAGSGTSYNFSTNFSVTGTTNVDVISTPYAVTASVATNALNGAATIVAYTNGTFFVNLPYSTNYFSISRTNMLQSVADIANVVALGGTIELKPGDYFFTTNFFLNRSTTAPGNWKWIGYGARVCYVGTTNVPYNGGLIETAGAATLNYVSDFSGNPVNLNFVFEGITFTCNQDWSGWARGGTNYTASDNRRYFLFTHTKYLAFLNCNFESSNTVAQSLTQASGFGYNLRPSGLVWIGDLGEKNVNSVFHGNWFAGGALGILEDNDNWDISDNYFSESCAWDNGGTYFGGFDVPTTDPFSGSTLHASAFAGLGDNGCIGGGVVTQSGLVDTIIGLHTFSGNTFANCATPFIWQVNSPTVVEKNLFVSPVKGMFGETSLAYFYGLLTFRNCNWVYTPMTGFTNNSFFPMMGLANTYMTTNELGAYLTEGIADDPAGGTTYAPQIFSLSQNGTNYFTIDGSGNLIGNGSGLTNINTTYTTNTTYTIAPSGLTAARALFAIQTNKVITTQTP